MFILHGQGAYWRPLHFHVPFLYAIDLCGQWDPQLLSFTSILNIHYLCKHLRTDPTNEGELCDYNFFLGDRHPICTTTNKLIQIWWCTKISLYEMPKCVIHVLPLTFPPMQHVHIKIVHYLAIVFYLSHFLFHFSIVQACQHFPLPGLQKSTFAVFSLFFLWLYPSYSTHPCNQRRHSCGKFGPSTTWINLVPKKLNFTCHSSLPIRVSIGFSPCCAW